MIDLSAVGDIQGYDIDGEVIKYARQNAKDAGVDGLIHFQQRPVSELRHPKKIWLCYYKSAVWGTS